MRLLKRLADKALRVELADVHAELEAERRMNAVAQAELDALSAVIARDRERVRAETAAYAHKVAEHEAAKGKP